VKVLRVGAVVVPAPGLQTQADALGILGGDIADRIVLRDLPAHIGDEKGLAAVTRPGDHGGFPQHQRILDQEGRRGQVDQFGGREQAKAGGYLVRNAGMVSVPPVAAGIAGDELGQRGIGPGQDLELLLYGGGTAVGMGVGKCLDRLGPGAVRIRRSVAGGLTVQQALDDGMGLRVGVRMHEQDSSAPALVPWV